MIATSPLLAKFDRYSVGAFERPNVRMVGSSNEPTLRGVALVLHGLNVNPARMVPLMAGLDAAGIECLWVALAGHGANYANPRCLKPAAARLEAARTVSLERWCAEVHAAYLIARTRSLQQGVPLYLAAYSLGATLACLLLTEREEVRFAALVLLAPALCLRPLGQLLRPLQGHPQWVVPSLSYADYRANRGTSMAAYRALYTALQRLQRADRSRLNCPTLVLMDRRDELVSWPGTRRLVAQGLDRWRLIAVEREATAPRRRSHHLILDPACVGEQTWRWMLHLAVGHLLAYEGGAAAWSRSGHPIRGVHT